MGLHGTVSLRESTNFLFAFTQVCPSVLSMKRPNMTFYHCVAILAKPGVWRRRFVRMEGADKNCGPLSLCCLCLCHKCSGRSTSSRKQRFAGEEMAKRNLCLGRSSDSLQESVRMCEIAPRCSKSLTCCDV